MRQLIPLLAGLLLAWRAAEAQQDRGQAPPAPSNEPRTASEANTSKDFVRLAFNFYGQKDGGGNPHLEEDMTVLEPQILIGKTLSEKWTASLKLQSDLISAASIDHDNRFPPGVQTGASGDQYFGAEAGAFYAWSDQTSVGGGVSYSTEYDYRSLGANLRWVYDTASKNDTVVVRASGYFDTLDLILFTGMNAGTDDRVSLSLGLGWTHIVGPETVATVNWDITHQNGFLSTPYNSVVAAGTEVQEILPDTRLRNSMFARIRHLLFEDLAVEPGIGGYFDSWGAMALNLELNLFWEPLPGDLIIKTGYRFHLQTEVDYFVPDTAASIPEFRTQDSDMADFTSHTLGMKFVFPHMKLLGDAQEVEIGFDYTKRSDDLDAFSVTVGYQWRY